MVLLMLASRRLRINGHLGSQPPENAAHLRYLEGKKTGKGTFSWPGAVRYTDASFCLLRSCILYTHTLSTAMSVEEWASRGTMNPARETPLGMIMVQPMPSPVPLCLPGTFQVKVLGHLQGQ